MYALWYLYAKEVKKIVIVLIIIFSLQKNDINDLGSEYIYSCKKKKVNY